MVKKESIKKTYDTTTTKKIEAQNNDNGVTESQIEFAKEICKQFNIKLPSPKNKKHLIYYINI